MRPLLSSRVFVPRALLLCVFGLCSSLAFGQQGSVPVRIEDGTGSHCIDASTERVTIHVRRLITEKKGGLFTEDKRAGVLVKTTLSGEADGKSSNPSFPSVDLVTIRELKNGQVSVAVEYEIASRLELKQQNQFYTSMNLAVVLAKTRGKNTFGEVLDLAGKALKELPIPPSPYTEGASKFLKFANDAIDDSIKGGNTEPFANISLAFNDSSESDLAKCKAMGKERTGSFAVVLSTGKPGNLVPVTNTEAQFCFRYSSDAVYEVLAARRAADGTCPNQLSAYTAISNDYVMFLMSAKPKTLIRPSAVGALSVEEKARLKRLSEESRMRCNFHHLAQKACG